MISMSKSKQLNLFDEFLELNYLSKKQPTGFLNLLLENFDLQSFISQSFTEHYYSILGRNRNYKLSARLFTLTIMEILHVTVNSLLYLFFISSSDILEFCGFLDSVPYESYFSRFKTEFEKHIAELFILWFLK